MNIIPMDEHERTTCTAMYLQQYRKELSTKHVKRIVREVQTSNPLYLRTLLEELRVRLSMKRLIKGLSIILKQRQSMNYSILFSNVLRMITKTKGLGWLKKLCRSFGHRALGVSESEILEMLGAHNKPMPMAQCLPCILPLRNLSLSVADS